MKKSTNKKSGVRGIRAFMIVNKDFPQNIEVFPNLYSGEVFFTASNAMASFGDRFPEFCSCGHKLKKPKDIHIKIIEVLITPLSVVSSNKPPMSNKRIGKKGR